MCVCNGRAGGVRTLLQPARAQCLRLSERFFIMRPSSLGGGRILRRTLSVCLSVCPSVCPSVPLSLPSVTSRHLANYNDIHVLSARAEGIRTFRHALRAAYRTAISAAQILVIIILMPCYRFFCNPFNGACACHAYATVELLQHRRPTSYAQILYRPVLNRYSLAAIMIVVSKKRARFRML